MISRQLTEVVANALRIDPASVSHDMRFGESAGWDSLNHVALMMALESEFGVSISDDDVVELTDLAAIERFLASNAPQRAPE